MTVSDFAKMSLEEAFELFHEAGVTEVALHHRKSSTATAEWFVTAAETSNVARGQRYIVADRTEDGVVVGTGGTPDEAFADAYLGLENRDARSNL